MHIQKFFVQLFYKKVGGFGCGGAECPVDILHPSKTRLEA